MGLTLPAPYGPLRVNNRWRPRKLFSLPFMERLCLARFDTRIPGQLSAPPLRSRPLMSHVVLLGDSIFDNAAYVRGGPDVIRQLQGVLPAGWKATLRAVDG